MPTSLRSACLASPQVASLTRRTAVYGPVRTVVWEGRAGNRSPYPDPDGILKRSGISPADSVAGDGAPEGL
jgi:hypothetical protein